MSTEHSTATVRYSALLTDFARDYDTPAGSASRRVWRVDGPAPHFVATSAATIFGDAETLVFACDEQGELTNWLATHGSFRGALDHFAAIDGYITAINSGEPIAAPSE